MAFILTILMISGAFADSRVIDHGVFGTLFPVVEEDMITVLKTKLHTLEQSGKLQQVKEDFQNRVQEKLLKPTPVSNLTPTEEERQWIYDPTLTLTSDIHNHDGQVIAKKGDRINPLHKLKPTQGLLLLDGDDPLQQAWAKAHQKDYVMILVKGKPLELEQKWGIPIYFDQGGYLCQTYGISHVPARVDVRKVDVTSDVLTVTEFKAEKLS